MLSVQTIMLVKVFADQACDFSFVLQSILYVTSTVKCHKTVQSETELYINLR